MRISTTALTSLLFAGFSPAASQAQTVEDAIEESVSDLGAQTGEDFISEMESSLYEWSEMGGSASDYLDASRTVIAEIDRYMKETDTGQADLPAAVAAMQMIALNYTDGQSASGLQFSPEGALELYNTGLVSTLWGPPMSFRGEYKTIMKRIYVERWNRSSLDGLVGEEAPSAYAKMLFDVFDAPTLCEPGEAVFWSCADPTRDRLLSVCGSSTSSRDASWVQYRVGQPGNLELSYPEGKVPNFANEEAMMAGEGKFSREVWRYGGSTLNFTNGAYDYAIEDETFTDNAIVTARRGDDIVFELSCKTTHPFMDTISGHLWGSSDDDRLHLAPGARDDVDQTACEADEDIVWSCLDTRDSSINSLCAVPVSDEPGFLYRKLDGTGTVTNSAFTDQPVPASSDLIWLRDEPTFSGIAIGDFAERYHFTTNKDGTGEFTWSKNEGERSYTQSCSVTHDNIFAILKNEAAPASTETKSFTYAPQPISYGDLSASPDEFDSLILQLKGLEAAGHFEAGAGMEELDVLGGQAAIPFALEHRDEAFSCSADHGGICAANDDLYAYTAFLIGFRGETGLDWFSSEARDFTKPDDIDLEKISLSFAALSPPGTPVVQDGDSFCQARAYFEDWEAGVDMYQSVAEQLGLEETPDYEWLWTSYYGVVGRYNVRAEPNPSASIVGKAENEAIHFPAFDEVTQSGGYDWRRVVLPDGTKGYIAASSDDLLKIDDAGQVCARMDGGEIKLTSIVIGGE